MKNSTEVIFNSMLKACPVNYNYNWSFNLSLDIKYNKKEYLGFKVFKWRLLKKDTIIFCDTCEIDKKNLFEI
jgi:hypothetical protein